ncbi:transglutaminase-like domain-containing protein [Candidatus Poseidoniales archaeon]|nr:transglutaminase-like domain-containing protein [Candidatus Poseidoniales archaeon]
MLANLNSKSFALEQQFNNGSADSTYKMTKKPTAPGVIQTHTGRSKNIMKRTRNKSRMIVMVIFIAFVFTSPTVQEASIAKFAAVKESVLLQAAPYHLYPLETTYSVSKTIDVMNGESDGYLVEHLIIPSDVRSLTNSMTHYAFTDGSLAMPTQSVQKISAITLTIEGGEVFNIPLNGLPTKSVAEKLTTNNGHEIWWPGSGEGSDFCTLSSCVVLKFNLDAYQTSSYEFTISLTSTAYSWWDNSDRVDSRVNGIDTGISMSNSGTFDDVSLRNSFGDAQQYRTTKWYDRGTSSVLDSRSLGGWAINAQHEVVNEVANQILQTLPEGESDNAYGYARAAFDYLHEHATYDKNAPMVARSGPECLAAGTGDCDEQTNAYLSLLRVQNLPGWYAFGALTDSKYQVWEAHAWGYIELPLSDEYCEAKGIELSTCFVQGQVDVVNNKWLLHTPTAYIAWIEQPDPTGDLLKAYYSPVQQLTSGTDRSIPVWSTVGDVDVNGGEFKVPMLAENLG